MSHDNNGAKEGKTSNKALQVVELLWNWSSIWNYSERHVSFFIMSKCDNMWFPSIVWSFLRSSKRYFFRDLFQSLIVGAIACLSYWRNESIRTINQPNFLKIIEWPKKKRNTETVYQYAFQPNANHLSTLNSLDSWSVCWQKRKDTITFEI